MSRTASSATVFERSTEFLARGFDTFFQQLMRMSAHFVTASQMICPALAKRTLGAGRDVGMSDSLT
jgi:hypothetical protein